MTLKTYRAKRDFRETPEPKGHTARTSKQSIFVVQEHHASHLHYDFRLEAEGVLKSWAVPKEPTLDPSAKRLAVQVEDHPLEYATFAGEIPAGHYGAGNVKIWDHGTYENVMADKAVPQTMAEALDAGHVEVALHGSKLKGKFALVRMKGRARAGKENWLLIKMKDEFAQANSPEEPAAKPRRRASSNGEAKRTAKPPKEFDEFTHVDKVMFPEAGFTKGDVIAFYDRIADRLLPHLKDRPVTLERLPEGLAGPRAPHFWQKDAPAFYPDWIPRIEQETEDGKTVHYALVNDKPTLMYLVNQGTLTFHTWLSRVQNLDRPDFVLFDLDRGKAEFTQLVDIARALHTILKDEKLEAFVKTSGKSGLHVMVPWRQPGGFDEARSWAETIAGRVVEEVPKLATAEIRKAKRGSRVYIDVMQNSKGHHAVPPYVIRATPTATVSTPLNWNEVSHDLEPAAFTIKTIFRRLARQKRDPLGGLFVTSKAKR